METIKREDLRELPCQPPLRNFGPNIHEREAHSFLPIDLGGVIDHLVTDVYPDDIVMSGDALGDGGHEDVAGDVSGAAADVQHELGGVPLELGGELLEDGHGVSFLEPVGLLVEVGLVHFGCLQQG